jgi:hypothetical protein
MSPAWASAVGTGERNVLRLRAAQPFDKLRPLHPPLRTVTLYAKTDLQNKK